MSDLENCPFCQTEIKSGAIVCIGCGANSKIERDPQKKGTIYALTALGVFGLFYGLVGLSMKNLGGSLMLFMLAVGGFGKAYSVFKKNPIKKIWYRMQ
jgi:hypothetical protein